MRVKRLNSVNDPAFETAFASSSRTRYGRSSTGTGIDCDLFTEHLDQIRVIRNEIMHFR